jgi:hypothetical protein
MPPLPHSTDQLIDPTMAARAERPAHADLIIEKPSLS